MALLSVKGLSECESGMCNFFSENPIKELPNQEYQVLHWALSCIIMLKIKT